MSPLFRNAYTVPPPNTPSPPSNKVAATQPAEYDSDHSVECLQKAGELCALSTVCEQTDEVPLNCIDYQLDLDTAINHLLAAVAAKGRAREATKANQTP